MIAVSNGSQDTPSFVMACRRPVRNHSFAKSTARLAVSRYTAADPSFDFVEAIENRFQSTFRMDVEAIENRFSVFEGVFSAGISRETLDGLTDHDDGQ